MRGDRSATANNYVKKGFLHIRIPKEKLIQQSVSDWNAVENYKWGERERERERLLLPEINLKGNGRHWIGRSLLL